ncbi:MAG: sulfatase [Planctomycetaceae bacterium]|nr:sulfatase [Planctomycetaceae bacterium]MBP63516.1 sulfatase [Planctomycetaceae bacterium]
MSNTHALPHVLRKHLSAVTRRHFFGQTGLGLGTAALTSLLDHPPCIAADGLSGLPHFAPRAKRAIYLFMAGAPCQVDMFDYKPKMKEMYDQDLPDSVRQGQRLTTMTSGQERFPIAPSIYNFSQYGQSGAWVSELMPHTAKVVDDLAIVRSLHTEAINHDPAITYICTGHQLPGRASLGSWLNYGLGSLNEDLPAFVVMTPSWTGRQEAQAIYNRLWGSGFLQSRHQGVALRTGADPVLFLSNPPGVDTNTRRRMLDRLARFNQRTFDTYGDPETLTRIEQGEMAFRMQASVPKLTDISGEPQHVLDMYGPDVQQPGTFAASALLARRMTERGVRFIQIFHRGWDQHGRVPRDLPNQCRDVDQPCWALISDLKNRGLLDDTLVVWGGEFGRTIYCQGNLTKEDYGRDHHPRCFTIWMAGGGIKPGVVYGKTDDFSYNIEENPVHIHDLNATILHCLGIDHRRLLYKFQGLDMRMTGVEDHSPVDGILL